MKRYVAPLLAISCAASAAPQSDTEQLMTMINAYRAAPGVCEGQRAQPLPALAPQPQLSTIRIAPATILAAALERAGYNSGQADAITVTGPRTPQDAMQTILWQHCGTLLKSGYTEIGSSRNGNEWTVVLAQPAPPRPAGMPPSTTPGVSILMEDWREAGKILLDGVNAARATARNCGEQSYPPAPPVRWNQQLGETALAHSNDMATQQYFGHAAKDGSVVGDRARRAGYAWSRIGENIAAGQHSPQETLDSWLTSPGHCANIMTPEFTEMGAAYGRSPGPNAGIIYWTQVFGKPR